MDCRTQYSEGHGGEGPKDTVKNVWQLLTTGSKAGEKMKAKSSLGG